MLKKTKSIGTEVRRSAINTDSRETMEVIKGWIEKCVDSHSGCASVQTTVRLPTRLLHIEKAGDFLKIRLCLSTALSPSTPYATLSHVWGSGSPMRLVSENVLQCQQDIPLARLPQTFIDAIKLTDGLGLSYLWIDSLCIVQDLTLDWEMESTTMCDVYRGSTINIAASASVNCDGGLFRQRNPLSVTPCILDISYKQKSGARLGEGGPYALMCEIACDRDPLVNEPLSRRAWTVQERILAPRTVYFTARKIYFVCCKKITSEVDPCSFNGYNGFNEEVVKTWTISDPTLAPPFFELDFCSRQWKRVVQQYTHGQLSLESDKLVAIAGLAKYMQKTWPFPNNTYLAGLWSVELLDWLMWRRSRTLATLTRPNAYRAPSWSWASVEGEVEWNSDRRRVGSSDVIYGASIVEARTSPTGDPYGSVYGGCIQIRGRLCITTRDRAKSQPVRDVVSVTGRHDTEHIPGESEEFMVLILSIIKENSEHHTRGLLIEYSGDKKGQFKRIGQIEGFTWRLLEASQSFHPADHLFMEVHENNEFTVELI